MRHKNVGESRKKSRSNSTSLFNECLQRIYLTTDHPWSVQVADFESWFEMFRKFRSIFSSLNLYMDLTCSVTTGDTAHKIALHPTSESFQVIEVVHSHFFGIQG